MSIACGYDARGARQVEADRAPTGLSRQELVGCERWQLRPLLASERAAGRYNLTPRARVVATANERGCAARHGYWADISIRAVLDLAG